MGVPRRDTRYVLREGLAAFHQGLPIWISVVDSRFALESKKAGARDDQGVLAMTTVSIALAAAIACGSPLQVQRRPLRLHFPSGRRRFYGDGVTIRRRSRLWQCSGRPVPTISFSCAGIMAFDVRRRSSKGSIVHAGTGPSSFDWGIDRQCRQPDHGGAADPKSRTGQSVSYNPILVRQLNANANGATQDEFRAPELCISARSSA